MKRPGAHNALVVGTTPRTRGKHDEAARVCESLLEITGDALMTNDFDSFAECFALPHVVETFEGRRTLETRAELQRTFDQVVAYYRQVNMTDLVRVCDAAEMVDDNTIQAAHTSTLLSGSRIVQEPFPCFSVYKKIDGRWRIVHSQYAAQPARHRWALTGKPETPPAPGQTEAKKEN